MPKASRTIDVTNIPELRRLAEDVLASAQPAVLTCNGEALVEVSPPSAAPKKSSRGKPVTEDDALFRLIGIGKSGITGGVSGKKHEYLAKSYRPS